jgi:hypothetical protein
LFGVDNKHICSVDKHRLAGRFAHPNFLRRPAPGGSQGKLCQRHHFNIAGYGKTPESYFRWGDEPQKNFTLHFDKIGLKGRYLMRDVWRQKDVAEYTGSFQANIPYHGVILLKFTPIK